jgi:prepilin-type processing-associated H-X9-DG protein
LKTGWDGVFGALVEVEGIKPLPALRLSKIIDGTSHTAALAEVVNGLSPDKAPTTGGDPLADCFEFGGAPVPGGGGSWNMDKIRAPFLSKDWRTAAVPWSGDWRYKGTPWTEGTMWRSWYNHLLPPNSVCWRPDSWWRLVLPASSYHPGAVNIVLVDGSVDSIADSIDPNIWTDLGTRNGLLNSN